MQWLERCRRSLQSLVYLLPALGRTLLAGPETVKFPFGPAEISEDYRGQITVDPELCRGCGLCVRDCPANALTLHREDKNRYQLVYFPERCAYCGQCETSCTFGALSQTNTYTSATTNLEELAIILVNRRPTQGNDTEQRSPE